MSVIELLTDSSEIPTEGVIFFCETEFSIHQADCTSQEDCFAMLKPMPDFKMRDPVIRPARDQLNRLQGKRDFSEVFLDKLRKVLDQLLCCLTLGCVRRGEEEEGILESELTDEEDSAIKLLLAYLNEVERKVKRGEKRRLSITDQRLHAICILTYSDNVLLQRAAAAVFKEMSESSLNITEIELEPLVVLLRSKDSEVQRNATTSIGNFLLFGPKTNHMAVLNSNSLKPLIQLLSSTSPLVQCNTCSALISLACTAKSKEAVARAGGLAPLLLLVQASDINVQRNASGVLGNLSHVPSIRAEMVITGALPILVNILNSSDAEVQSRVARILGNIAVDDRHRPLITALGHYDCMKRLIELMNKGKDIVKIQACFALRNLAHESENQILLVRLGILKGLKKILGDPSKREVLLSALMCLKNLSIHKNNESRIVQETFLSELVSLIKNPNVDIRLHTAGIIRNLSAGDQIVHIIDAGCVEALIWTLLQPLAANDLRKEVANALVLLADDDAARLRILRCGDGNNFVSLMRMVEQCGEPDLQYHISGVIAQLVLTPGEGERLSVRYATELIHLYGNFLNLPNPRFIHLGLYGFAELIKYSGFREIFTKKHSLTEKIFSFKVQYKDVVAIVELSDIILQACVTC